MNYFEKTYWDMEKKCVAFLNANTNVWNSYQVIKEDYDSIVKNEKELSDTEKAQSDSQTEGHVAQKRQEILLLGKAIYRLSCSISHLAKKTNNQVLLKIVDISESGYVVGEEKELMSKFQAVLEAARNNLKTLALYSVTAEGLDLLDAQYKNLIALPETIGVVAGIRKSATRSIKELNAEARVIFDRLDDVLEAIITDEKFLEGWFDARKIKGRHRAAKKTNGTATEDVPPVV